MNVRPPVTNLTKDIFFCIFANHICLALALQSWKVTTFTLIEELSMISLSVKAHENQVDLAISLNLSHATISGIIQTLKLFIGLSK